MIHMGLKSTISTIRRTGTVVRIAHAARKLTKANSEDARRRAKVTLARLMADARGVPMKAGQFIAGMPDQKEFSSLVEGIEPRPWAEMEPILEASLARPLTEIFQDVDPSGIAASLGQVHRGVLRDGREVAIKIQYPDIKQAVEAEMKLAGLLPGAGPVRKWGFDLSSYKMTLKQNMDRELDYQSEMQRQERFADALNGDGLVVPQVIPEHCGHTVLVQHWESANSLDSAHTWPMHERERLARTLLRTLLKSLFVLGEIHSDPHQGNIKVRRGPSGSEVVMYDFGSTVTVDRTSRLALLKMILGARRNDQTDPLACLAAMGFDADKLKPIADTLPAIARLLVEPFVRDEVFFPKHWNLSNRMKELLGELRWWFRSAGPSKLLLFIRGFSGVIHHIVKLRVGLPFWNTLREAVGSHMLDATGAFDPPAIKSNDRTIQSFDQTATLLRVRVSANESRLVDVSMPATEAARLAELIPGEVLARLTEHNIDIAAIAEKACCSGLKPQELFVLHSGEKHYHVWLE